MSWIFWLIIFIVGSVVVWWMIDYQDHFPDDKGD